MDNTAPQRTGNETIMVVDDTPANLTILVELLGRRGYRVAAFPRGDMALKAAAFEAPDLILLDIMMPGMDGLALFRRIRGNPDTARIPVVFVSVRWDFFNDPAVSSDQRVKVLRKPFDLEVLVRTVKESLP